MFEILNAKGEKALSQSNCRSEVLSTELNYLIGSILNKIKVRGKSYTYTEFSEEFRGIVEDSDAQELKEILVSNRIKCKNFGGSEIAEELKEQDVSFEASATFSEPKPLVPDLNLKINRIS